MREMDDFQLYNPIYGGPTQAYYSFIPMLPSPKIKRLDNHNLTVNTT